MFRRHWQPLLALSLISYGLLLALATGEREKGGGALGGKVTRIRVYVSAIIHRLVDRVSPDV